ncbi:MAG TPA: class I lanthipeptide [Chitinophaga sp.]|uniref:class I lanthipeptide n=1 Tax=Chitinophaga sp. TaxID=1869181 RepID=UPI002BD22C2E|nr:class I lanthipeptide [Chitinophaga sp.]HVI46004.1 class I lanthipeptide [Chitinophaga sp.]
MKQPITDKKLSFSKEKIANLSADDLNTVQGGLEATSPGTSRFNSSRYDFTCCLCTTIAPEESLEG